ncbi:MAG: hypothetical protein ACK4V4_07785 [Sphingobacteriales bacterium]
MKSFYYLFMLVLLCSLLSCEPIKEVEDETVYERTNKNYGNDIELLSTKFDLPQEYLKALIILESSGNKKVPPRYEAHVFQKLVKLRNNQLVSYEKLKPYHVKDATDDALKNLSTSWGPFQIMGYKCLELGVSVSDLRGDSAVYWGVYWINKEYGQYLKRKKYTEAFKIHNTGSPTGETYDSKYVSKGLSHINYFERLKN